MKLRKCEKAQIRIIEAFFAALLIISSLFLIPSIPTPRDEESDSLYSAGMNVLLQLDADGTLSEMIENKSWSSLRKCLQQLLPSGVWFNLTVLNSGRAQLNDVLISNGSPISDEIIAIEYLCVASNPKYSIYVVRLQLARAD